MRASLGRLAVRETVTQRVVGGGLGLGVLGRAGEDDLADQRLGLLELLQANQGLSRLGQHRRPVPLSICSGDEAIRRSSPGDRLIVLPLTGEHLGAQDGGTFRGLGRSGQGRDRRLGAREIIGMDLEPGQALSCLRPGWRLLG